MYNIKTENLTKSELESLFIETVKGYLDASLPLISNLANLSAIIKAFFPALNWSGFYLLEGEQLYLGPFQGKPACTTIKLGQGVCGKAAKSKETIIVKDVLNFPGHITCDIISRSELVIPIIKEDKVIGVLDLDSPKIGCFDENDQVLFEKVVGILIDICL